LRLVSVVRCRVASNAGFQGFDTPVSSSASSRPAAVPFVIPHFLNPVATKTFEAGSWRPTNGSPSTGA
jgi:hypothetical protein